MHQQEPLSISSLQQRLREFAAERDWDQFHSPKNLAMALIVEAAELVEHFQWLSEDQSRSLAVDDEGDAKSVAKHQEIRHEMADIMVYLVRLADKLGVDLMAAVAEKIELNEAKYPAARVRGRADKYTAYQDESQ